MYWLQPITNEPMKILGAGRGWKELDARLKFQNLCFLVSEISVKKSGPKSPYTLGWTKYVGKKRLAYLVTKTG